MDEYVWLQITKSQAQNLMDLIDLWFYREIREDENLDNVMWAWELLDIYKRCKDLVYDCDTKREGIPYEEAN